jgi:deoxyribodipyrimidine photo-lyase
LIPQSNPKISVFWFRRDLRLEDNVALYKALSEKYPVQPVFIFDTEILDKLEDKDDGRVTFIHQELQRLNAELQTHIATLIVKFGKPLEVWDEILRNYDVAAVFANEDYEPYARDRDNKVEKFLQERGIPFLTYKDHLIFSKSDILKNDGKPYAVYTPYSKQWKLKFQEAHVRSYPSESISNYLKSDFQDIVKLTDIGFTKSEIEFPDRLPNDGIISKYDKTRDIPSINGTSRMSAHLRFGTISIRRLMKIAIDLNEKYWNELIWREFYSSILWHFPQTIDQNYNRKYDGVEWINNEDDFDMWCQGRTGYPIVDAGMRELNVTGFMHNRVRMIVSSFLTKHLLTDWRWGEAYFARKLLDFEQASNVGGWQWAAGTGVDAAPYFRVFNPTLQMEKFDPDLKYVKKWIPEYGSKDYPNPIVDHKMARVRAIQTYKKALSDIF